MFINHYHEYKRIAIQVKYIFSLLYQVLKISCDLIINKSLSRSLDNQLLILDKSDTIVIQRVSTFEAEAYFIYGPNVITFPCCNHYPWVVESLALWTQKFYSYCTHMIKCFWKLLMLQQINNIQNNSLSLCIRRKTIVHTSYLS